MLKKILIGAAVLVIAFVGLWYFNKKKEVTGGAITYTCDGKDKSFTLTYVDKDTQTLSGYGGEPIALDENAAGYWVSADGKATVKQVGPYVVLVWNDKVTHDKCEPL